MHKLSDKDKIIYFKVYEEVKTHQLYDSNYFVTFEDFLIFCEEKTPITNANSNSLLSLALFPKNQFKKIIAKKICEYYLTTDNDCNPNPPITYWKCTFRR